MQETTITLDEWDSQFVPLANPFDRNASFDGVMLETYGQELELVQNTDFNHVWTYCDGDEGELLIVSGYSYVNRIGYFVTKNPWTEHTTVIVED